MNPRTLSRTAVALAVALAASTAAAEGGAGALYDRGSWPGELARRPLTLPSTMLQIDLELLGNVSKGADLIPILVTPALALGLTDDVTLSAHGTGRQLCLSSDSADCVDDLSQYGAEVRVSLSRSQERQSIARVGADALAFAGTTFVVARLGLATKFSMGNLALATGADLLVGVTERDNLNTREALSLWAEPVIQITPMAALTARLAANMDLEARRFGSARLSTSIDDTLQIPLTLGIQGQFTSRIGLGVKLVFPDLLGPHGSADGRGIVLFAEFFL